MSTIVEKIGPGKPKKKAFWGGFSGAKGVNLPSPAPVAGNIDYGR
jgi:hypothetical protein